MIGFVEALTSLEGGREREPGREKVVFIKKETCHFKSSAVEVQDGWFLFL
jgi:hypothetical protein